MIFLLNIFTFLISICRISVSYYKRGIFSIVNFRLCKKLRIAFAKLNARAQEIAIERLEELAKIPEYQNPDFPDNFEFPDDFLSDVAEPDEEP